jgi:hypothetical protein
MSDKTDIVAAPAYGEQKRLADGWSAQCGAVNTGAMLRSLKAAIAGCVAEGVEAIEDTGIGLVVHQLMYLQRAAFGQQASAYDTWIEARRVMRDLMCGNSRIDNAALLKFLSRVILRCDQVKEEKGPQFKTDDWWEDSELTLYILKLYVITRADWLDKDGAAYSAAYDKAKAASEAHYGH